MKLKKTITCLTLLGLMNFYPINTSLNTTNINQIKRGNDEATQLPRTYFNSDKEGNVTLDDGTEYNVYDELNALKEEYVQLKDISDSNVCIQLNSLIKATEQVSLNYTACINTTFVPPILNPEKPSTQSATDMLTGYYQDVIAAIALFHVRGLKLAAELLTNAIFPSDNNPNSLYIPVHSDVAYSSQKLLDVVESSDFDGGIDFLPENFDVINTFNTKELDLGMSLGNANFEKSNESDSILTLSDKYDFHYKESKNTDSFLKKLFYACNNVVWRAQQYKLIQPFKLKIDLDFTHGIFPESISFSDNKYTIKTKCFDENSKDFIFYNKKLCNYSDAKEWKNLTDISTISNANGSEIKIEKNWASSSVTLSYIQNNARYITVISGLNQKHPDIVLFKTSYNAYAFSKYSIQLLKKDGENLTLNIINKTSENIKISYLKETTKKVNQYTFDNKNNLTNATIYANKSLQINIEKKSDNNILFELFGNSWGRFVTIEKPNFDGATSANISEETIDMTEKYLSLRKLKKSSQWEFTVYNPFDYAIDCYYNSKMCFEGDAQNWSGLQDVHSITINGKGTALIKVSGNFFATTAVFSYIKKKVRYITYANNLNSNGTMTIKTSKKA